MAEIKRERSAQSRLSRRRRAAHTCFHIRSAIGLAKYAIVRLERATTSFWRSGPLFSPSSRHTASQLSSHRRRRRSCRPFRIAAQIVTGVGFLGAGAIIRDGLSVRGLTTAGSLWVSAGIGMAAATGWFWAAGVATALTLMALGSLRTLSYRLIERMRPEERRLVVELEPRQPIEPFLNELGEVHRVE
jgi:hypothetical protein